MRRASPTECPLTLFLRKNNHCWSPSAIYPLRGPRIPHFLPACLFKVVFVYAEAQLSETYEGSVLGSFHRGSILFLIKWHSVAGGLAGTQLPGKPKNAGLHLATHSYCLRRLVLHSRSSILVPLRPMSVCLCVCACHCGMRATVVRVRYGDSVCSFLLPRLLNNVHWELLSIPSIKCKTNVGILCSLICFLRSRRTSNVSYNGIDMNYNMYI